MRHSLAGPELTVREIVDIKPVGPGSPLGDGDGLRAVGVRIVHVQAGTGYNPVPIETVVPASFGIRAGQVGFQVPGRISPGEHNPILSRAKHG